MYSYIQLKNINNDDDRYLNKLSYWNSVKRHVPITICKESLNH